MSNSASNDLHELDVVARIDKLAEENLSAGQTGTIVFVHRDGDAFEVEFPLNPHKSIVATVQRRKLLKLKGLSRSGVAG